MHTTELVAVAVAGIASVVDLRTRRIPNLVTFPSALLAIIYHSALNGPPGAWHGVLGWLSGLALFLPFYLLRGMGAGDVKLLAALGAWLGAGRAVWIAIFGSIAGGVLAVGLALATGYGHRLAGNLWLLLSHWRVTGVRPLDSLTLEQGTGPRLAYAVPIAIGLLCTIAWR
jgi:prepilin peptidase CpaA